MKRFPYFLSFALVILSSCSGVPMPSTIAAPTSSPSDTPEPTYTPLPTETATPSPTATPNASATAIFRTTQAAGEVLSELDNVLEDSDIPYQEGHLAWQQTGPIAIHMSGPDQQFTEIDDTLRAGNFILKSDVTWEATGLLICGAIFRSEPNLEQGKQYQFYFLRFSGLPAWTIGVHEFGQFQNSPTKAKFSDALDLGNGATNQFILVVEDDHFTLYLNSVRQGTYFDYSEQRSDGSMGFLGAQQSGKGTCQFENSWVWALE
ncbi:MAG TPA: hypothetical protein VJ821_12610 [Anaerolineales bacterium]|nr:hypothetical protein [Anaerolineales bacterium]